MASADGFSTVEPVFVLKNALPGYFTSYDMCLATEKACGTDLILGAQEIRGLWRIYPTTREARTSS